MRRILAQACKELAQLMRDRLALTMTLVLPVMIMFIVGTSFKLTVSGLPIVVRDLDGSSASRRLIDAFRASVTVHVMAWPVEKSPDEALQHGALAVLVIPVHFGRDMLHGTDTPVQLLVDASDSNTARLMSGYAGGIIRAYNAVNAPALQPIQASIRLWFNPGLSDKLYLGPGVFVMALSMFIPLLASLAMAKEGQRGTIQQVYVSSIPAHEYLFGNILAFMVVGVAECVPLFTLLFTYFGVRFAGDPGAVPGRDDTVCLLHRIFRSYGWRCNSKPGSEQSPWWRWAATCWYFCYPACCFQSRTYPRESVGFPISSGASTTSR